MHDSLAGGASPRSSYIGVVRAALPSAFGQLDRPGPPQESPPLTALHAFTLCQSAGRHVLRAGAHPHRLLEDRADPSVRARCRRVPTSCGPGDLEASPTRNAPTLQADCGLYPLLPDESGCGRKLRTLARADAICFLGRRSPTIRGRAALTPTSGRVSRGRPVEKEADVLASLPASSPRSIEVGQEPARLLLLREQLRPSRRSSARRTSAPRDRRSSERSKQLNDRERRRSAARVDRLQMSPAAARPVRGPICNVSSRFRTRRRDALDLTAARAVLDEDHSGSIRSRTDSNTCGQDHPPARRDPIRASWAPGVGKTSLWRRSHGRSGEFHRIRGRNAGRADIRCHRRLIGALRADHPGLRRAESKNPVLMLAESTSWGGIPRRPGLGAARASTGGDSTSLHYATCRSIFRARSSSRGHLLDTVRPAARQDGDFGCGLQEEDMSASRASTSCGKQARDMFTPGVLIPRA